MLSIATRLHVVRWLGRRTDNIRRRCANGRHQPHLLESAYPVFLDDTAVRDYALRNVIDSDPHRMGLRLRPSASFCLGNLHIEAIELSSPGLVMARILTTKPVRKR